MMNIELLKEEIKAAEDRIGKDQAYIRTTRQEMADYSCPFSVGDKVVAPDGGKEIIASIEYCEWNNLGYDFKIFKIKKNGEPYVQSQNAYAIAKYTKAI